MTELEVQQRAAVVAEARSWLGTPYHHMGRVKGVGADCLTLPICCYQAAGIVPRDFKVAFYPRDWNLHRADERYLEGVLQFGREIEGPPLPGDLVLWKFGRCFAHGAVVVDWPVVIHAHINRACILEDVSRATWLNTIGEPGPERGKARPRKFFSPWAEKSSAGASVAP